MCGKSSKWQYKQNENAENCGLWHKTVRISHPDGENATHIPLWGIIALAVFFIMVMPSGLFWMIVLGLAAWVIVSRGGAFSTFNAYGESGDEKAKRKRKNEDHDDDEIFIV